MGIIRKLFIGISTLFSIPVLLTIFRIAKSQYHLVKSTHTIDDIPRHDPVFLSPAYQQHFGHRKWAKIESFACGVVLPLAAVRTELLNSDEAFAAEIFKILWNERMSTQFRGPPSSQPPKVGDVSASEDIRAEVVDMRQMEMSMTITTASNGFTGGLEVIQTMVNHQNGVAGILIKYLWHNDVVLPRKWYQYFSIWLQLTSRRIWLLNTLSTVSRNNNVEAEGSGSQGQERTYLSSKVEL